MAPVLVVAAGMGVVFMFSPPQPVGKGVALGLLIALVQSFVSVGSLGWALNKEFFYWIWGAGVLFRFLVFFLTAFFVYRFTSLSLVATLVSLVTATTLFLVVESAVFLKKS